MEICRPSGPDDLDTTVIASDTIRKIATSLPPAAGGADERDDESPGSLAGAIALAKWAIARSDGDHHCLSTRTSRNSLPDGVNLEDLRARYDRGDRLAFRYAFPNGVRRQGAATASAAEFRVYLERAEDLEEGHDYFVRGHLRIPDMDHLRSHRSRALVYVDSRSELAHLLRDSEGPAHARWDPHAQRLKQHWRGGYERVQGVRRAAVRLLQLLAERGSAPQMDALADLFPGADDPTATRIAGSGRGSTSADPPPIPEVPPSPLALSRKGHGFLIRPSGRPAIPPGAAFTVRFAYDVARGDAFRAYESGLAAKTPDFSLKDDTVSVECRGCGASILAPNALLLTLSEPGDFECSVTGFDGRDVIVRLDPSPTAAPAPEGEA